MSARNVTVTVGYIPGGGQFGPWDRWGYRPFERRDYADGLTVVLLSNDNGSVVAVGWPRRTGLAGWRSDDQPVRGLARKFSPDFTSGHLSAFVRQARQTVA